MRCRSAAVAIALLFLPAGIADAQTPPSAPTAGKPPALKPVKRAVSFVIARRTVLWRGNEEYCNVGVNIPDLFELFLFNNTEPALQVLSDARRVGATLVRCFGSTWGAEHFDIFENDRARWLAAYDAMLTAADAQGIGVVPSLLFNIRMIPQYVARKTGKDEGVVGLLTPGTASNEIAVEYVTAIVTRYKTDPRVLFWEIGNEYNLEADLSTQLKPRPASDAPNSDMIHAFLVQMATLIKRIDKKHLVTSGNADMRVASWRLRQTMLAHKKDADPNNYAMDWTKDTFDQYRQILDFFNPPPLDIISSHLYPPDATQPDGDTPRWLLPDPTRAMRVSWTREACEIIGRPLFVGEFGEKVTIDGKEQTAVWTQDFFTRLITGVAPVSAVWAWEFKQDNMLTPYSLSITGTPNLATLLANTNNAIRAQLAGTEPLLIPIPK